MGYHHMNEWDMPTRFFHFGFGGMFMWIIFIALIAVVVYFLIKQSKGMSHGESALDIAKKRYARGEITKEELDEIKKNL